jgi:signal transduction histidine kinase
VEREAERLEGLLAEVLTLARLKETRSTMPLEKIDLMDLIVAIVEDANFEGQAKGRHVRLEGAPTFVRFAEGEVLYRAFENVIRNAVKYSSAGGEIIVRATALSDRLVVEVIDEGPGVPEAARSEIFDAFKRLEGVDNNSDGYGLGLAIAREAIERHGGAIRAEDGPGGIGLRMILEVPREGEG